jgi:hypothetical protein
MKTFYEEKLEYFGGQNDNAGYWDYNLIDVNPSNGYEVCYSESDDEWYGHLLSNDNPELDFKVVRDMEVDEIACCIVLIPAADLPSILLAARLDEALELNAELEVELAECRANK